jgi:hypothetical protein
LASDHPNHTHAGSAGRAFLTGRSARRDLALEHWGVLFTILNTLIELITFTGTIYLARRFLDRRSFASLGLKLDRRLLPDLLAGIAITFIMMGFDTVSQNLIKSTHSVLSTMPFVGRVRGWRHDLGVADPLLSVSCESASVPSPCLVSIPCHLEPDMRFFLIRLSDNLLLAVFKY